MVLLWMMLSLASCAPTVRDSVPGLADISRDTACPIEWPAGPQREKGDSEQQKPARSPDPSKKRQPAAEPPEWQI